MAQSTAGIKVYYSATAPTKSNKSTAWKEIPDITSIPALGGEPNMLDVTVLSETDQKRYIAGLKDNSGSMQYNILLTTAAFDAVTLATTAAKYIIIEFPTPFNKAYYYEGKVLPLLPGEAEVDGVLSSVLYTSMETAPVAIDMSA